MLTLPAVPAEAKVCSECVMIQVTAYLGSTFETSPDESQNKGKESSKEKAREVELYLILIIYKAFIINKISCA